MVVLKGGEGELSGVETSNQGLISAGRREGLLDCCQRQSHGLGRCGLEEGKRQKKGVGSFSFGLLQSADYQGHKKKKRKQTTFKRGWVRQTRSIKRRT